MVYKSAESKEMIRMSNEPTVLEDIAGQAMFVKDAMGWRETGKYPKAVLLHGPPGTGKSSAALVLTRELQGEWFDGHTNPLIPLKTVVHVPLKRQREDT